MNTLKIEQLLGQDFSVGTEKFREDLLQRCLVEVDKSTRGRVSLSDEDVEMLAAAGAPYEDPESAQRRLEDLL